MSKLSFGHDSRLLKCLLWKPQDKVHTSFPDFLVASGYNPSNLISRMSPHCCTHSTHPSLLEIIICPYHKVLLFLFPLPCPSLSSSTHLLQAGTSDCPGQSTLHLLPWVYAHVPRQWAETHSWQLLSKLKMHLCRLSRAIRLMCSNMSRRVVPSKAMRCHLAWTEKGTELRLPDPYPNPNHLDELPTQAWFPLQISVLGLPPVKSSVTVRMTTFVVK